MSLIRTRNLLSENVPYTRLRSSEVAGTTSLRVQNTDGLTTGWGIQIGQTGGDQTEVVVGTNSNGTTITNAATTYDHPIDTPVYFIKYDQVVFERSTAGTAGTATPMTNGTVTYMADDFFTIFDDTSGSSAYGYRTYFRNSVLTVNSTESDWVTFAGNDFYSLARIRDRMRRKLWNSKFLEDQDIDDWINECKDKMVNKVINVNEDYALGTANISFGTNGLGTITNADFVSPVRMWVGYNNGQLFQSTKSSINTLDPNRIYSSVHPYHAWIDNNVFIVNPADNGGTAEVVFQKFGTIMVNDTDILPIPMRSYTDVFVEYCQAQALAKDGKYPESEAKLNRVGTMVDDFAVSISPRDKTGQETVDIVEPVQGDTWTF